MIDHACPFLSIHCQSDGPHKSSQLSLTWQFHINAFIGERKKKLQANQSAAIDMLTLTLGT